MLEKIADIRFNNQMNENKNGYKSSHGNSSSLLNKSNSFDSINISPAFHFFSRMNAKILNIFNNVSNKYELVFELNGIVFDLIIDLPHLFEKNEIQFKLKSVKEEKSSANVFLKIYVDQDSAIDKIKTENIARLFQKISDTGLTSEQTVLDSNMLSFLLDGIEDEIISELKSVARLGLHFVEKLFEIKIFEKIENKKTDSNNIQIQLIKSTDFMRLQNSE
jgi:hypothetical protein